jgi:glycosyltransferase involved in cell wall biosynthesis
MIEYARKKYPEKGLIISVENRSKKSVLIDTRMIIGAQTGVGRYITNLINEIIEIAPTDLCFSALSLSSDKVPIGIKRLNLKGIMSGISPGRPLQQLTIPWSVYKSGCELYHYPSFDPPFIFKGPIIATCHDIEPLRCPELFSTRIYWYYRMFTKGLRRAKRIITVSENTRKDLVDLLGIAPERITVIYHGVSPSFKRIEDPRGLNALRNKYQLPERYILYIGNTMPHKNLPRLISAMCYVHEQEPDVELVLGGRRDKHRPSLEHMIKMTGLENYARFLGIISDDDLPTLLSGARAFVYPSLYEGFGLPVLEAMACGVPVVTSNRASLPEVVGDSALVVDPKDSREIARAILRLLRNPIEAKHFINASLNRVKQFTWRRCAEQHISVYREVLEG